MLWSILFIFFCVKANVLLHKLEFFEVDKNSTVLHEFSSLTSNFGPDLDRNDMEGTLYLANPIEACSSILPPSLMHYDTSQLSSPTLMSSNHFVLIKRSESTAACSFEQKVFNAQTANYNAAIVFNDRGDNLVMMQPSGLFDPDAIQIPSIFIGRSSGRLLMNFITNQSSEPFKVLLRRGDFKNIKFYLIPFICVLLLAISFTIIIVILRLIARYRKERANRLPKSALKNIPIHRYSKCCDDCETCPICLDDFVEGCKVRTLFCSHIYHCKCIDPWLLYNKRTCPVCKRKVVRYPGDAEANNSSDCESYREDDVSETVPLIQAATSDMSSLSSLSHNMDYGDDPLILTDAQLCRQTARAEGNPSIDSDTVHRVFFIGSVDRSTDRSIILTRGPIGSCDSQLGTLNSRPNNRNADPNNLLVSRDGSESLGQSSDDELQPTR